MYSINHRFLACACAAAVLASQCAASAAPARVAAAPLHSAGTKPAYPRLTKFPDAKVMARVNAALAALETADRGAYADCLSQLKDMKRKPDKYTWDETVAVTYLSAQYLGIDVTTSYDCAGAYPTNGAETPVTYDLHSGAAIDWTTAFRPGFLPSDSADPHAPPAALTRLYRARYRPGTDKNDADCRSAIADMDPFASPPIIRLDAKSGIVFQPDFPHATAACADPLTLKPAEIAPYLKDVKLAADLKMMVKM